MYLKRKYQVGGIAYTPFLPAQAGSPQESTSNSGSSSTSSPEKMSGTMKKEIVDLLKSNGIPSDVSTFLNVANQFLTKSRALSTSSLFGGTDDYDISDLIKIQQLVNDVKYNNALKDEAVKQITKEAAGSEVAITDNGYIYAYNDKGNIVKLTPKEYKNGEGKYQPLTNNQLLYAREHEQGLAFQTGILNDLQNTIGMNTITKQLRDTINAFGSDKVGGYTTKDSAVNEGLRALMQAGPDGFYQFESEEELRNVNRALRYLYNSMPENAKNLLRAKTAVDGGNPNDPNDISNLLLQALYEHTSRTNTVKFDKTATDFDPNQTGQKGGSEQKVQNTYLYRIASLNGPRRQIMLAPSASKIFDTGLMVTQGIVNGAVVDKNEKRIGNMSVSQFLQEAEAVKAADASTIVFGNRLLKPGEYDGIMFDSNEECNTVLLPYKYDDGRIVPDFDTFTKFNELQNKISGKFSVPKTEVDRIARDLGLDSDKYNYDSSTNSLTLTQKTYFLQFGAIASDNALDLTKENEAFLQRLDKSDADFYRKEYENMVKYGKLDRKKSDLKVGDYKDNMFNRARFYKGWLYMAMPDAYRGAHLSMNEYINRDDVNNFGRRTEMRQQQIAVNDAYQQAYGNIGAFKNE